MRKMIHKHVQKDVNLARKTIKISPTQVKEIRKKGHLTQKEAADLVHLSLRQWQKFEESELSNTSVRIPDATLELFCLKTGLPFPPVFERGNRLGKTVSFAGGPGGIGRSTLTRDIALILAEDNFEVLIITDKSGQLIMEEKRYIAKNKKFPKILESEEIDWHNKKHSTIKIKDIKNNYDFIFFDLEKNSDHLRIDEYEPDLIITPINPSHHYTTSLSNILNFSQNKEKHSKTIIACLLVGVSQDFTFNYYYHSLDQWLSDEIMNEIQNSLYHLRKVNENCLKDIKKLNESGIYFFDCYSSDAYNYYDKLHHEEHGIRMTQYHFLDKPNTLSAHQMNAIKNELLRILNVKKLI
ncbi:hypothetical protein [Photobacterium sp. TLY01]|uniref:hypothetical protein n=1 Tax=Photobacterium sp. TLY01 TaxID=2907534 RepID=UPI001F1694F5|nr:hypothetical protein [Photobacterium sp. TLY01]UIP27689.1 hypothetical protein LN341_13995 [Photobacterium sp. TLY01]